jgi:arylsulfatase A-like enzyme
MEPYAREKSIGVRQHHGDVTQLDAAFGRLMAALDELKLAENTLVVFTADNGPEGTGLGDPAHPGSQQDRTRGSTGGLRGRKRYDYEGGIRVPGMVRWPDHIIPGTVSSVPVVGTDLFTTICDIVDIPLPGDRTIDGANIRPAFEGRPVERRKPLYWRTHNAPPECRVALRIGDWKIVADEKLTRFELYNIAADTQETTDRASTDPERFAELKRALLAMDAEVMAEGPDWWKHETEAQRAR